MIMSKKQEILEGEAANQFLQGVAKPNKKSLQEEMKGLSYNIHKLNKLLTKLIQSI